MADVTASNAGAERLRASGRSLAEVVRELATLGVKVERSAVQRWRDGSKRPGQEARLALAKAPMKVPIGAWDLPVANGVGAPPADMLAKAEAKGPAPPASGQETAAEAMQDVLARIQRWRHESESTDNLAWRKQLVTLEMAAIGKLALYTGEGASDETKLVKSSAWLKLRAEVLDALGPFPEAMRALRAALK